ncbi:uncharacterized protein LOC110706534 [Chenopodium quinoa]|uniref:uncharacterized protein LOC110706534 n=1 Tax=Chenopodium quinoa TaxID=63459 RepID=UPI000B77DF4F|nr:uncharacterized protein LOC110706534 [Chenopodium quinoa]
MIIWDEAFMAYKENMESLDLLLQDLCENNSLFGGKLVVFRGDFCQMLPIVLQLIQRKAVQARIVTSYLWSKLQKFKLAKNIRARADPKYFAFLLSLGNEIMAATFPEFKAGGFGSDIFTKRAIITPMNDDVDLINSVTIKEFPGTPIVYKSYNNILDEMCTLVLFMDPDIYNTSYFSKGELALVPHSLTATFVLCTNYWRLKVLGD